MHVATARWRGASPMCGCLAGARWARIRAIPGRSMRRTRPTAATRRRCVSPIVAEPPGGRLDPTVANAVRDAAAGCGRRLRGRRNCAAAIRGDSGVLWAVSHWRLRDRCSISSSRSWARMERSSSVAAAGLPPLDAAAMSRLFAERYGLARAWSQFMAEYPLILSPVWTQLPFEVASMLPRPKTSRPHRANEPAGGAGQPVWAALGLRARRPRRRDGAANRRTADRTSACARRVPRRR